MELTLRREEENEVCTIGHLSVDGTPECVTSENVVRAKGPKAPGTVAIPAGRYLVTINEELPHVDGVPGREGICIHDGRADADSDGGILVGESRAGNAIYESAAALAVLQGKIQAVLDRREEVWLTVVDYR